MPNFAGHLSKFVLRGLKRKRSGERGSDELGSGDALGSLTANLTTLFPDTKKGNNDLWKELHEQSLEQNEHGLCAILISPKTHCRLCGKLLHLKAC